MPFPLTLTVIVLGLSPADSDASTGTARPTDARLTHRAIEKLVELAKREGVGLRQSYLRLAKRAAIMVGRYTHAHQFNPRAAGTEVSAHAAWPHHP